MAELYLPDASNWISSFEAGQKAGMTARRQQAQQAYGQRLMTGDTQGAAQVIAGDSPELGLATLKYGKTQEADNRAAKFRSALSTHDYSTARQLAAGDPDLHKAFTEQLASDATTMATYAQTLKGVPLDQARERYQKEVLPKLHAQGVSGPGYDDWDPTPQNIQQIETTAIGLKEALGLHKPDWHEAKAADGSSTFKDLNPYNRQDGSEAPTPSSPAAAPPAQVAAAPDPNLPRGLRNNNPLNLEATVRWNGMNGSDGRYATFGTPEDGWRAADRNLSVYGSKHGINTIAGVINRWAPPTENDTAGYVRDISSAVGIDPNANIDLADPMVRRKVLEAMATVENGHPVAWGTGGQVEPVKATPVATASRPIGDGVPTIAGSSAQPVQWVQDGKGNLVNAKTGDRKVDPTFDGIGAADPNVVKMVLDGRYPPPTGRAAADPKWQAVLQAAAAEDPNFNAADYHTRYATRKDFTSGKASQNITALNTALGHIGELAHKIDGLGNTSFTPFNEVKNYIADKTGDPRYQAFNTDKKAVASELVRVFRGAGGAEADIKDFQAQLDSAGSPAQLHAVTQEMVKLLASRLDSLAIQYKQGLGQDKAGIEFLTPKAAAIYSQITGVAAPSGSSPAPAAAGARPPLDSFRRR